MVTTDAFLHITDFDFHYTHTHRYLFVWQRGYSTGLKLYFCGPRPKCRNRQPVSLHSCMVRVWLLFFFSGSTMHKSW